MFNNVRDGAMRKKHCEYQQGIVDYYSKAGMDYAPWSRKLNMHFGYYRRGVSLFDREKMLDEMNNQMLQRLQLNTSKANHIIDLGCGVGASARYAVEQQGTLSVTGATIVPWQIEQAQTLSQGHPRESQLSFEQLDFNNIHKSNDVFDGAYAMESSCYSDGKDKRPFLLEAFRVLKPGARLVIADGFTKGAKHTPFFTSLYKQVCKGWALQDFASIDAFTQTMQDIGFEGIQVQDASWRVAPSVMFVPWVSIKYYLKSVFLRSKDKNIKKGHFLAPMYGMLMGLHRKQYAYHIVSAKKPSNEPQ